MPVEVEFVLVIIAALLAGAVFVWLLMRSRAPRAFEAGKTESLPELERLSSLVEETEAAARRLKEEHIQLGKDFAVAEEKNRSIPELKSDRTALEGKIRELQKERTSITADLAKEKQRSENLDSLNRKLDQREKAIDELGRPCPTRNP